MLDESVIKMEAGNLGKRIAALEMTAPQNPFLCPRQTYRNVLFNLLILRLTCRNVLLTLLVRNHRRFNPPVVAPRPHRMPE